MTKEQLWKIYSDRTPSFNGSDRISMSAAGIRKMFEQTWEIAYQAGIEDHVPQERMSPPPGFEDLFGFGKPSK